MKKIITVTLLLALLLGLCACGSSDTTPASGTTAAPANDSGLAEGQLLVGYGKINITPEVSVPMGGYGNSDKRMSTGFMDYLYATCIAVTDAEGNSALLFGLDLCNTSAGVFQGVRDSLSQKYGIPVSSIVLSASHMHSAPDLTSSLEGIQKYTPILSENLLKVAEEAMEDRAPTDLYINSVQTTGLNFVRRYVLEGNIYVGYQSDIEDLGLPIIGHESDADGELQLVKFVRADEDKKDILLANFQTHPHRGGSAKNTLMTADLVGAFRTKIEEELDCHAIYFTGASGNINPTSQIAEENITSSFQEQGQALAQYAIDADSTYTKVNGGNVQSTTAQFEGKIDHSQDSMVAIATQVKALWAETNSIDKVRAFSLPYGINSPYHANAICTKAGMGETSGFDVWAISIGDVGFAVAPYEMFDTNGMFIKENSPFEMTIVATCANGGNGYFPSMIACEHGGYEPDTTKYVHGSAETLADLYVGALTTLYATK